MSTITDAREAIQRRDLDELQKYMDCWSSDTDGLWNVPKSNPNLLELAVDENYSEAVELLLSRLPSGPEPSKAANEALLRAVRKDLVAIVRLFLEAALKGRFEITLYEIFLFAILKGHQDIALQVIGKPEFDVNSEDPWDGHHPLALVISSRSVNLVECLLKAGAIIDAPNNKGETALVASCAYWFLDGFRLLLLHGANPNHHSLQSLSPLRACYAFATPSPDPSVQCEDSIRLLLRAGLNVNRESWIQKSTLPNNRTGKDFLEWLRRLGINPQSLKMICFVAIRVHLATVHRGISILRFLNELPLPVLLRSYVAMSEEEIRL